MASSTRTREEHQTGYTTDFCGEWTVTPPLTPNLIADLKAFAEARHDPTGDMPGYWCQWVPSSDGTTIGWDGGEKFYNYEEWIKYLIEHFLRPWGYVLNGDIEWQGEDSDDRGVIRITDNVVEIGVAIPGYLFPGYAMTGITTTKGTNMTASNTKTITATVSAPVPAGGTVLPAAVPAAVLSRKPQAAGTQSKNVHNFAAWKDAIGTAQSATGYDTNSPIYGKTDIEVLTLIRPFLADVVELLGSELAAGTYTLLDGRDVDAKVSWANAKQALADIDEMVKRKVAKQIAGQTYKSRKAI